MLNYLTVQSYYGQLVQMAIASCPFTAAADLILGVMRINRGTRAILFLSIVGYLQTVFRIRAQFRGLQCKWYECTACASKVTSMPVISHYCWQWGSVVATPTMGAPEEASAAHRWCGISGQVGGHSEGGEGWSMVWDWQSFILVIGSQLPCKAVWPYTEVLAFAPAK